MSIYYCMCRMGTRGFLQISFSVFRCLPLFQANFDIFLKFTSETSSYCSWLRVFTLNAGLHSEGKRFDS